MKDSFVSRLRKAMVATKQQERAALHKIREIVASLGENSYLAAAFDGTFEIAEQNEVKNLENLQRARSNPGSLF